jgi:N6-adenosine-specific RNA methylase IME4
MCAVRYRTIIADPPWNERGGGKIKRGADKHYTLMKTSDIMSMDKFINEISDDNCHLYLWVTNNFLPDGFGVMDAWGFRYVTCITWTKDKIGLGQYFRGQTEQCLFGIKGKLPYKVVDGKRQQATTSIIAPRTTHSKKPGDIFEYAERVSYGPYIELFARERRDGWACWGNEVQL